MASQVRIFKGVSPSRHHIQAPSSVRCAFSFLAGIIEKGLPRAIILGSKLTSIPVRASNTIQLPSEPMAELTVTFESLPSEEEDFDHFVMPTSSHENLPRALWTTSGIEEMHLRLSIGDRFLQNLEVDRLIASPYYCLRGIKNFSIPGYRDEDRLKRLTNSYHKYAEIQCFNLVASVLCLLAKDKTVSWQVARSMVVTTLEFLYDCQRVDYRPLIVLSEDECRAMIIVMTSILRLSSHQEDTSHVTTGFVLTRLDYFSELHSDRCHLMLVNLIQELQEIQQANNPIASEADEEVTAHYIERLKEAACLMLLRGHL